MNRDALEARLGAIVRENRVPSAVIAVRSPAGGDATLLFGEAEIGGGEPPALDHRFRVGSLTKTMTGAVALQLIDEGLLAFDDPIAAFVGGVPGGEGITIADLLQMRSGLFSMDESEGFVDRLDAEVDRVWTVSEIHRLSFGGPPPHSGPREGFHYSNINYYMLGEVIEQVTGATATRAFDERLFAPLGMTGSSLPMREDAGIPEPFARGYQYGPSTAIEEPLAAMSGDERAAFDAGTLRPRDRTGDNPGWGWTAGSAISTPRDLTAWARELVDGSLLSEAMRARRLREIPDPRIDAFGPGGGYGNGIARANGIYWHNGQLPGYSTYAGHDPATGTTVSVNTGLTSMPRGGLPADTLALATWELLGGAPPG